jgi:hypothetical protein
MKVLVDESFFTVKEVADDDQAPQGRAATPRCGKIFFPRGDNFLESVPSGAGGIALRNDNGIRWAQSP